MTNKQLMRRTVAEANDGVMYCPLDCYAKTIYDGDCAVDYTIFTNTRGRYLCPFYASRDKYIRRQMQSIMHNSHTYSEARAKAIKFMVENKIAKNSQSASTMLSKKKYFTKEDF